MYFPKTGEILTHFVKLHQTLRQFRMVRAYLSKRWQKLQEVILSKVCILNWWELWLAFSGRIFDLRRDERTECE